MEDCFSCVFEKILFDLNEHIHVSDYVTDELLYLNRKLMDHFNIGEDYAGKPCYKLLMGNDERCSFCPKRNLAPTDFDKRFKWKALNPLINVAFENEGYLVKWHDGKPVYFQKSIDITDQRALEKKSADRLVRQELISQIAQSFIWGGETNLNIDNALKKAADIMNYQQAMLLRFDIETKIMYYTNLYLYEGAGMSKSDFLPKHFGEDRLVYDRFITNKEHYIILRNDECAGYVNSYKLGFRSMLIFPVWYDNIFLGVIKFDRFDAQQEWIDDDLNLAGMIAGALAGVLNRERISYDLNIMTEVVRHSSQMFSILEPNGKFRFFNDSVSHLTGYSRIELDKYGYKLLHNQAVIERISKEIIPAVIRGERVNTELSLICKDKSKKFMQFAFFPINSGVGALAIDVTDEKRLRDELDRTKQQLAVAVEASGIGVWEIDVETQLITFDGNFAKIFRLPEIMKSPLSMAEWTDYTTKIMDMNRYANILEYHKNYDGSRVIVESDITLKFGEDDYQFIRYSNSKLSNEVGYTQKSFGITWDVTNDVTRANKLNEIQERLDIAIQISKAGTWEIDLRTSMLTIDEGLAKLIRLEGATTISMQHCHDYLKKLVHGNDGFIRFIKEGYQNPYDFVDVLVKYEFSENDVMYLSHSARVVYGIDGKAEKLIGMSVDVTRFTLTEIALERQLKQQVLMADIAQRFVDSDDINSVVYEALRLASEFSGIITAQVYKYYENSHTYAAEHEYYKADFKFADCKALPINADYLNRQVNLSESAVSILDNPAIPASLLYDGLEGTLQTSHMLMPLIVNGKVWGLIGFAEYECPHSWNDSDKDMLRLLAGLTSTAIENEIAKAALSVSQSTLNAVIDNMPIAVYWKNMQSMVFEGCNQAYLNILGKTADEVVGKKDYEIFTERYMPNYLEHEKQALECNGTLEYETDILDRNDKKRTMKLHRIVLCNHEGVPYRVISTVEDITESNRKERQIREMLKNHNLVIKNYNGVILNVGSSGKIKLFGGKSLFGFKGEEILGKSFYEVYRNQPQMIETVSKCFAQGTQSFIFYREATVTRCQATQIFDDDGNVASVLFVGQDITELYKVQRELEAAIVVAEEASRSKSDFLARMSHEIRTPMNAIVGMSKIACKVNETDRLQYCLNKISVASDNLLELINQILDMSKIEANKLELEMVEFNLIETINEIITVMSVKIEEKNLNLSTVYESRFEDNFIGDKLRLSQIITNLLSNAIKFTEAGGSITIKASAQENADENLVLTVSVIDTGIGVRKEQQKTIFNSFEQADGSTSRKYGGSGLGLAICKNLVTLMGGDIYISSEEGKGSDFTFNVLLKKSNGQLVGIDDQSDNLDYKRNIDGKVVMLAEDNEINREIVIYLLEDMGIKVHEAENGRQAVELYIANPKLYDLILMDIQMPEMDGYEATRIIRNAQKEDAENIGILAMTANVFKEDIERCLEAGMNDHIPKPIDTDNLRNKIYKYIR